MLQKLELGLTVTNYAAATLNITISAVSPRVIKNHNRCAFKQASTTVKKITGIWWKLGAVFKWHTFDSPIPRAHSRQRSNNAPTVAKACACMVHASNPHFTPEEGCGSHVTLIQ